MSSKFAFVSTLAVIMLLNGLTAGAVTQSLAKDGKKDDNKKEEISLAAGAYQPALMKPASWRHFQQQQQHRHHRYSTNA
jgi:hypothetical protein